MGPGSCFQTPERFQAERSFVLCITSEGWARTAGNKSRAGGGGGGGGEELGLCIRQTCPNPDFTVSFSSSWLRVCFEAGTFLGMGNRMDAGQRRALLSGEAKKKTIHIQILRRLHNK